MAKKRSNDEAELDQEGQGSAKRFNFYHLHWHVQKKVLECLPFESIMTASQVCTDFSDEISTNEKILAKIAYAPKTFKENHPRNRQYFNMSLRSIPTSREFDSMFAGHFHDIKSLKIVVHTPFHHLKDVCDKLPNLQELYIEHKKRNKHCFPSVADQASLNTTSLKVVKIRAKSMKFAAGFSLPSTTATHSASLCSSTMKCIRMTSYFKKA